MANQPPYPQGPYPHPPQAAPAPKKGMSTCLIVFIVAAVLVVPVVFIMLSLGIYGVRRYLLAAKTAEAKNTIGAISRAAVAAYESESVVGGRTTNRLCGSAITVPAKVPAAAKYQPSTAAGADFQTGTPDEGWACLRFSITTPIYYQYQYHQGSGYVVPSPAAGRDGFEAVARGDLDGNGTLSTFALTGRVVSGSVVLAPNLYIEQEFE